MDELEEIARQIRVNIVKMVAKAGLGHPGGSLSSADILTALYWRVLRIDPANPNWPGRDRFILSKGHACPSIYSTLALRGYYPISWLYTEFRSIDGHLQGHPTMEKTPGIDFTSGSLGNGLALGNGMALGGRLNKQDYRVYVLLSDGELQEGSVWEAAMMGSHLGLDRVCAIVDANHLQNDGFIEDINNIYPLAPKWLAHGWHVIEIDGHDFGQILGAFAQFQQNQGKPTVIIANTIKGKGVSFMENHPDWHGRAPNPAELAQALIDLKEVAL